VGGGSDSVLRRPAKSALECLVRTHARDDALWRGISLTVFCYSICSLWLALLVGSKGLQLVRHGCSVRVVPRETCALVPSWVTVQRVSEKQCNEPVQRSADPGVHARKKCLSLKNGSSYWLTRFVILRLLGFVYSIAFLVAVKQIVPLVGEEGLLPGNVFLERVAAHAGSRFAGFQLLQGFF